MASEWNMPRRSERCVGCDAPFEIGQTIRAYLFDTAEGYARRDFCLECAPDAAGEAVAAWRTRRPEPSQPKNAPFDRAATLNFFRRLDEDDEQPEKQQFRFVLALLLWRKKALTFDRTEFDGDMEWWHFSEPKDAAQYRVRKPQLDETQVEQLSAQLEALLAEGVVDLERPAAPAEQEAHDVESE